MAKPQTDRTDYWLQMVTEHESSGLPVRTFCEAAGVNEHSFYNWRARLRKEKAVRFALVEPEGKAASANGAIEVTLASGEQLRIGAGVNIEIVRTVLAALRP